MHIQAKLMSITGNLWSVPVVYRVCESNELIRLQWLDMNADRDLVLPSFFNEYGDYIVPF
jgi:hypothetical protein